MEERETEPIEETASSSESEEYRAKPEDLLDSDTVDYPRNSARLLLSTFARACVSTSRTVFTLASRRDKILSNSVARIKKMRGTLGRMEDMIATGELPRAPETEDTAREEGERETISVPQIKEFIGTSYKSLELTLKDTSSLDGQVKESRKLEMEVLAMIAHGRELKRILDVDDKAYSFDLSNPRGEANVEVLKAFKALNKSFLDLQRRLLDFSESVVRIERSEPIRKMNDLSMNLRAGTLRFGCPSELAVL